MKNERPNWFARLINEANDINAKMSKLRVFMATEPYRELSDPKKNMLNAQYCAMATYVACLEQRIATGWEE